MQPISCKICKFGNPLSLYSLIDFDKISRQSSGGNLSLIFLPKENFLINYFSVRKITLKFFQHWGNINAVFKFHIGYNSRCQYYQFGWFTVKFIESNFISEISASRTGIIRASL